MKRNMMLAVMVLLMGTLFIAGCSPKRGVLQEEGSSPDKAAAVEAKPAEKEAPPSVAAPEGPSGAQVGSAADAGTTGTGAMETGAKEAEAASAGAGTAAEEKTAKVEAASGAAKELYEFADVHFDYDKSVLRDDARDILKKHAEWLNKNKGIMIVVEGHCDERGTAEYNLALGERRAEAAAKFLFDMGIDAKRIKTISYGKEMPLDPGHNEDAWAKNRRGHFVISAKN